MDLLYHRPRKDIALKEQVGDIAAMDVVQLIQVQFFDAVFNPLVLDMCVKP